MIGVVINKPYQNNHKDCVDKQPIKEVLGKNGLILHMLNIKQSDGFGSHLLTAYKRWRTRLNKN